MFCVEECVPPQVAYSLFLEIVMDVKVGEEEDGMEILGSAS